MYKKVKNLIATNTFASATIWMTAGMMFANIGAFFFIFLLVRILTPNDYAVMVSLISAFNLLIVPAGILQITVVAKVAEAKGRDELGKVSFIYTYFFKRLLFLSGILLLLTVLFNKLINNFLHIKDTRLLLIICIGSIGFYFIILARSILQGMSAFKIYSFSTILEMFAKITIAIILVLLGLKVFGAVLSFLFSEIIVAFYTLTIVQKKYIRGSQHIPIRLQEIMHVGLPTTFMLLGLTSFYTTDVLLVKHYFPDDVSNQALLYAGVSTLGKIIFFGTAGISSALLPITAERHAKAEQTKHLLYAGLGLVLLGCIFVTAVYFTLPKLALTLLGKTDYLQAAPYLGIFGIFISLHAIVFLLSNYLISVKRFTSAYVVFTAAVLQVVAITLFHTTISQVIFASTTVSALLLATLLLVYVVKNAS